MPRKKLISTNQFPYHIYNRSNNKEFFYLSIDKLWEIFLQTFKYLKKELNIDIKSFVLMNNHYHLVLSTPNINLSEAMTYLHREVARNANKKAGRINHFFGARYKWSLIQSEHYYWNVIKYVFRNPVKAGLCKKVEEYNYSSLNIDSSLWKLTDFFNNNAIEIIPNIDWLNLSYDLEIEDCIQKALNKKIFEISRNKNGSRIILPRVF